MHAVDLDLVAGWLAQPHVARWYLAGSTTACEIDDLARAVRGEQPVHALVVTEDEAPVGWCQWYRGSDDPDWAADVGAGPDDVGIDYAIGVPHFVGRGLGTDLVAHLVRAARHEVPGCAVVSDPDARNTASRRVLEKNGFALVARKVLPSEHSDDPMAVYRLPASPLVPRRGASAGLPQ